ncbi:MAG: MaoC/PaaZ C-terminal domain-containing protein, partial [Candidatus Thorarchaeota archaeon]|nr:MaoC/PaaZ C-terminal domain-containing protein [Candidatus Thorarchaeota archaeon]
MLETTRPTLDRSYIGKEYRSSPQIASAESMIQYARATNETNPRYYDSESPGGLIPSPLYSVVFIPEVLNQFVDDAEEMNLDILRVVHAEQEIWWRGRIHPGDRIISTMKIVSIAPRGVNEMLDLHIQITREDVILVDMDYRLMLRGKKKAEEKKSTSFSHNPTQSKKLAQGTILVAQDQGLRYAEASGDHNPIHVSDVIARSVGLPGAILHGLCTMAFASQVIVDELLDCDPSRLQYMKVRFTKPV